MSHSITALTLALLAASVGVDESLQSPTGITIFPAAAGPGFYTVESLYRVYRSADEFIDSWPRASTCDDACAHAISAQIDFKRHMLIVIAPRGRGQQTYDVVVTSVAESNDAIDVAFLELRYGEVSTGEVLCGVILVIPQPAIAVLVPQSGKRVRFFRSRADVFCEKDVQVQ